MNGEKEFKKEFHKFLSYEFNPIQIFEILGCFLIMFIVMIGLSYIMDFKFAGTIGMILFFSLVEGFPFKLNKYLPSEREHQKKVERFRKSYWGYIMKNQDKTGKLMTKSFLAGRGEEI